jgi:hypothetical protein
MLELLLANQEKAEANQERLEAERQSDREDLKRMMAEMNGTLDANHTKMDSTRKRLRPAI